MTRLKLLLCALLFLTCAGAPAAVSVLPKAAAVTAGDEHTLVIDDRGTLWTFGAGKSGQLGNGVRRDCSAPAPVMEDVQKAVGGSFHTLALGRDGSLWGCGSNRRGQLARAEDAYFPTLIPIMKGVADVAAGEGHSLVLKRDGTVWGWGLNKHGQLGNGTTKDSRVPVCILRGAEAVCADGQASYALKGGALFAWGFNEFGQMGTGDRADVLCPVKLLENVVAVATGGKTTFALTRENGENRLYGWGDDTYGQIGQNVGGTVSAPAALEAVAYPAAGWEHTLLLDAGTRTLTARGSGRFCQGTLALPVTVDGPCRIACADASSFFIDGAGVLYGWGDNARGQLGSNVGTAETPGFIVLGNAPPSCTKTIDGVRFDVWLNQAEVSPGDAFAVVVSAENISDAPIPIVGVENYNGRTRFLKASADAARTALLPELTPNRISDDVLEAGWLKPGQSLTVCQSFYAGSLKNADAPLTIRIEFGRAQQPPPGTFPLRAQPITFCVPLPIAG